MDQADLLVSREALACTIRAVLEICHFFESANRNFIPADYTFNYLMCLGKFSEAKRFTFCACALGFFASLGLLHLDSFSIFTIVLNPVSILNPVFTAETYNVPNIISCMNNVDLDPKFSKIAQRDGVR